MDSTTAKKAPRVRDLNKARHRQKIIDATIDCIAKYGIPETTVSRVVEKAGLSRGMINLHFQSKDALFIEVLTHLAEQYRSAWAKTLERSSQRPLEQLIALIETDLSPKILNKKNVPVWIAFRSLAHPNPAYTALCSTRDKGVLQTYTQLCKQIIREEGYEGLHPASVARGLLAMGEGMWIDYMIYPKDFKRESAMKTFTTFLKALFPNHFPVGQTSQTGA
jgi:TetR/AcrR family transcriptional repressor of bet genes